MLQRVRIRDNGNGVRDSKVIVHLLPLLHPTRVPNNITEIGSFSDNIVPRAGYTFHRLAVTDFTVESGHSPITPAE